MHSVRVLCESVVLLKETWMVGDWPKFQCIFEAAALIRIYTKQMFCHKDASIPRRLISVYQIITVNGGHTSSVSELWSIKRSSLRVKRDREEGKFLFELPGVPRIR